MLWDDFVSTRAIVIVKYGLEQTQLKPIENTLNIFFTIIEFGKVQREILKLGVCCRNHLLLFMKYSFLNHKYNF